MAPSDGPRYSPELKAYLQEHIGDYPSNFLKQLVLYRGMTFTSKQFFGEKFAGRYFNQDSIAKMKESLREHTFQCCFSEIDEASDDSYRLKSQIRERNMDIMMDKARFPGNFLLRWVRANDWDRKTTRNGLPVEDSISSKEDLYRSFCTGWPIGCEDAKPFIDAQCQYWAQDGAAEWFAIPPDMKHHIKAAISSVSMTPDPDTGRLDDESQDESFVAQGSEVFRGRERQLLELIEHVQCLTSCLFIDDEEGCHSEELVELIQILFSAKSPDSRLPAHRESLCVLKDTFNYALNDMNGLSSTSYAMLEATGQCFSDPSPFRIWVKQGPGQLFAEQKQPGILNVDDSVLYGIATSLRDYFASTVRERFRTEFVEANASMGNAAMNVAEFLPSCFRRLAEGTGNSTLETLIWTIIPSLSVCSDAKGLLVDVDKLAEKNFEKAKTLPTQKADQSDDDLLDDEFLKTPPPPRPKSQSSQSNKAEAKPTETEQLHLGNPIWTRMMAKPDAEIEENRSPNAWFKILIDDLRKKDDVNKAVTKVLKGNGQKKILGTIFQGKLVDARITPATLGWKIFPSESRLLLRYLASAHRAALVSEHYGDQSIQVQGKQWTKTPRFSPTTINIDNMLLRWNGVSEDAFHSCAQKNVMRILDLVESRNVWRPPNKSGGLLFDDLAQPVILITAQQQAFWIPPFGFIGSVANTSEEQASDVSGTRSKELLFQACKTGHIPVSGTRGTYMPIEKRGLYQQSTDLQLPDLHDLLTGDIKAALKNDALPKCQAILWSSFGRASQMMSVKEIKDNLLQYATSPAEALASMKKFIFNETLPDKEFEKMIVYGHSVLQWICAKEGASMFSDSIAYAEPFGAEVKWMSHFHDKTGISQLLAKGAMPCSSETMIASVIQELDQRSGHALLNVLKELPPFVARPAITGMDEKKAQSFAIETGSSSLDQHIHVYRRYAGILCSLLVTWYVGYQDPLPKHGKKLMACVRTVLMFRPEAISLAHDNSMMLITIISAVLVRTEDWEDTFRGVGGWLRHWIQILRDRPSLPKSPARDWSLDRDPGYMINQVEQVTVDFLKALTGLQVLSRASDNKADVLLLSRMGYFVSSFPIISRAISNDTELHALLQYFAPLWIDFNAEPPELPDLPPYGYMIKAVLNKDAPRMSETGDFLKDPRWLQMRTWLIPAYLASLGDAAPPMMTPRQWITTYQLFSDKKEDDYLRYKTVTKSRLQDLASSIAPYAATRDRINAKTLYDRIRSQASVLRSGERLTEQLNAEDGHLPDLSAVVGEAMLLNILHELEDSANEHGQEVSPRLADVAGHFPINSDDDLDTGHDGAASAFGLKDVQMTEGNDDLPRLQDEVATSGPAATVSPQGVAIDKDAEFRKILRAISFNHRRFLSDANYRDMLRRCFRRVNVVLNWEIHGDGRIIMGIRRPLAGDVATTSRSDPSSKSNDSTRMEIDSHNDDGAAGSMDVEPKVDAADMAEGTTGGADDPAGQQAAASQEETPSIADVNSADRMELGENPDTQPEQLGTAEDHPMGEATDDQREVVPATNTEEMSVEAPATSAENSVAMDTSADTGSTNSNDAAPPQQPPNIQEVQQPNAEDINATTNTGNVVASSSAIPQQPEAMDTEDDEGVVME